MRFRLLAGIAIPVLAMTATVAKAQDAGDEVCNWDEVASDNMDNPANMVGATPSPTPAPTDPMQSGNGFGTPTPGPTPIPNATSSPVVQPLPPSPTPAPSATPTPRPTATATPRPGTGGGGGAAVPPVSGGGSATMKVNTSGRVSGPSPKATNLNGASFSRNMYQGVVSPGYQVDLSVRRNYTPGAGNGTLMNMGGYTVRASGVSNTNITQNVAKTIDEVHLIFKQLGQSGPVFTSGRRPGDSGSKHATGNAYDIRCNDKPDAVCKQLAGAIASALGPAYDVLFEDFPAPHDAYDHIHVEYDPGK